MDLTPVQPWLVLGHVVSAFAFVAAHGVAMAVFFRFRTERDRAALAALIGLSSYSMGALYTTFVLLLLFGIVAGIVGDWWTSGRLWLWASVAILVVIVGAMYGLMTTHYIAIRRAIGIRPPQDAPDRVLDELDDEALARLLTARRPVVGAAIGIVGLVVIIWLMVMRPF